MAQDSSTTRLQCQGSQLARWLLRLLGWRIQFEALPALQGVAVVYPHTSNWDAPVIFLVKWATGIQAAFWAKASLFEIPLLGRWLRWIGAEPVMRTHPQGLTGQMMALMKARKAAGEYFWLGLSPEGTRKRIPGWRSGFYQIALAADVPVLVVTLDFGRKLCRLDQVVRLTGQPDVDMAAIAHCCDGVLGFKLQNMSPIVLLDASVKRSDTVVK